MKNNEEMLKKFPTMKSLDADKKASKTSEAAPAVAASVSAASALSIPIKMSTFFGNSEHPFPEK